MMTWPPELAHAEIRPDAVGIWGFLKSEIGLGAAARSYATTLREMSLQSTAHDVPLEGRASVEFDSDDITFRAGTNLIVMNPPELLAGEQFFPHRALSETRRIGIWAWELSRLPNEWIPAIDLVDEIWTGSTFIANAVRKVTTKCVRVVPCPILPRPYLPIFEARSIILPAIPADEFVFLMTFDFASSSFRKNPLGVVSAFHDAFPGGKSESPYLVVKCHGGRSDPKSEQRLHAAVRGCERIVLINSVFSPREMAHLQDACNCYISLHRGEGFGLNVAEMMRAGKPVIVTSYSGNMDFTCSDNSFLVDYRFVPVREGEYPYAEGQVWAEPDQASATTALRKVYDDPNEARHHALVGRETILSMYSVKSVAATIRIALHEAEHRPIKRVRFG